MLKIHGIVKVNDAFIEKTITIDRNHPKFQIVLDFISRSSFIRKWNGIPPYAIKHFLDFYLDDGQQVRLAYDDGCLWWESVYQASVDPELGNVLDAILLS